MLAYAKAQGMYHTKSAQDPIFTDVLKLELASVEPSLAGPKRPQDRVPLKDVKSGFAQSMDKEFGKAGEMDKRVPVEDRKHTLGHGDVVIAAITSCTNTSNPSVMIAAGLVARKAVAKGLTVKPWVKTSLAPGSQVVGEYLSKSGLQKDLDKLGFNLVGFGCTTCIGNSGPLPAEISKAINDNDLVAAAVLSGNRNFEGRVNADVRANYLASPPLVVAYAIAGSMQIDIAKTPLGTDQKGRKVYLRDIWPTSREVNEFIRKNINKQMFTRKYGDVFKGDANWRKISVQGALTYPWDSKSTYVQNPPYFAGMSRRPEAPTDIVDARVLGLFLDSITTDHISPAGSIKVDLPAGKYLVDHKVKPIDFNQYGTRRGNHEVMMRGTFANIRLKNQMVPGVEGGYTIHYPSRERMTIYDAAMRYKTRARAAGGVRRQGIRHRLVARLGRQGHDPARRARGDRAVVRAHPSLQSGRHGRGAAGVRGRHLVANAGLEGRRAGHHPRPAHRSQAASAADCRDRRRRWRIEARAADLPHRYRRRARLFQEWRHIAVCAAPSRGLGDAARI